MDFHEINTVGKLWIERVNTLPTWTTADAGRLVYVVSEDNFYKGGSTDWELFGRSYALWAGLVERATFEYNTALSINIKGGRYHHATNTGTEIIAKIGDITFAFGSAGSNSNSDNLTASDWHYLYLDNSRLDEDVTAGMFINSTSEPQWIDSKLGWYGLAGNVTTNDRCIGAFYTNSSSQIARFWQVQDMFMWDAPLTIFQGTWPTSWTVKNVFAPTFTKFIYGTIYAYSTSPGTADCYWRPIYSTGAGFRVLRVANNQQSSMNEISRMVITDTISGPQIAIRATAAAAVTLFQNGYYLPYGM